MTTTSATPEQVRAGAARRRARRRAARSFSRPFTTPEGATIDLRIASGGERAGAFLIDMVLLVLALLIGMWVIGLAFSGGGRDTEAVGGALLTLYVFGVRNFYFIAFEMGRRAATPGKRLLGLRVAARDGARLTGNAVLTRNLVREVEVFLPLYFLAFTLVGSGMGQDLTALVGVLGLAWTGVFLFFPLFNRDRLRLGDLIAGTWVVHMPKPFLAEDMAVAPTPRARKTAGAPPAPPPASDFTLEELSVYGERELQVLEDVLRASPADVRASVATRIRRKIGRKPVPGEDDFTFLTAYYVALRQHLESGLVMGRRKRDKHDTGEH